MRKRTEVGPDDVERLRKAYGLTQVEMADAMHLPLRTYEDLVKSRVNWRPIHRRAYEMGLMSLAWARDDTKFLPPHLRDMIIELHKLIVASEKSV